MARKSIPSLERQTQRRFRMEKGIYRRKDGSFEIYYRDRYGKQHFDAVPTRDLGEARQYLREIESARFKGTLSNAAAATVGHIAAQWLKLQEQALADKEIRRATFENRERDLRLYIVPTLGSVRVRDLDDTHMDALIAKMREAQGKRKQGLARSTQRNVIYGTFSPLLEYAKARPLPHILSESQKRRLKSEKSKARSFEDQELVTLFATIPERYRLIAQTALLTGLRVSEVLGLRKCDVGDKKIHVRGQLDVRTRRWIPETKGDNSKASVFAPTELVTALRSQAAKATVQSLSGESLVFSNPDGSGYARCSVGRAFKQALKDAGLDESKTFHKLRHTYVSALLETLPLADVSERARHASPAITSTTYAHARNREQYDEAAEKALKPLAVLL